MSDGAFKATALIAVVVVAMIAFNYMLWRRLRATLRDMQDRETD